MSIACEPFQNDKWPHEGNDSVLYMDMNDLDVLQAGEILKEKERSAAEEEGYKNGYAMAKQYYCDAFKDIRFEGLLARKIKEWQESGDNPDVMKEELEMDAELLKAFFVRTEGRLSKRPSYDEVMHFCDRNYDTYLRSGKYFVITEFANGLVEWCFNRKEEETDKTED